ncbi:unnamed protein product [Dovyalis caffra]|uniref:Uncharacterized protein n=1 Tax=Dovyalis caffra TaxID=77055 RepID=A0AAV1R8X6_9ROSI|nr:unnamed protein product [Dovyalis caffra]
MENVDEQLRPKASVARSYRKIFLIRSILWNAVVRTSGLIGQLAPEIAFATKFTPGFSLVNARNNN